MAAQNDFDGCVAKALAKIHTSIEYLVSILSLKQISAIAFTD